jgi:very-short-patch-repair endonuclease
MSLSKSKELIIVAKLRARELRKNPTMAEQILWEQVRDRKFLNLKFYRQHPIFVDEDGKETFYIADFYCHLPPTVIELDGAVHDNQQEMDARRTDFIEDKGIKVLRFKNKEIETNVKHVLDIMCKLFRERM